MASTSLIIKTLDSTGKKNQTTATYANPKASSEVLRTFAQKLVALTNDSYVETNIVDKINADTEEHATPAGDGKLDPNMVFLKDDDQIEFSVNPEASGMLLALARSTDTKGDSGEWQEILFENEVIDTDNPDRRYTDIGPVWDAIFYTGDAKYHAAYLVLNRE